MISGWVLALHLSGLRVYQGLKLDVERGCRLETHDPCAGPMKDKM
jgi:hypothetical protein